MPSMMGKFNTNSTHTKACRDSLQSETEGNALANTAELALNGCGT
jgi:hypothetical protein